MFGSAFLGGHGSPGETVNSLLGLSFPPFDKLSPTYRQFLSFNGPSATNAHLESAPANTLGK